MKQIILLLLLLPIISAIPTLTLQHEQIQPGETILATISTPGEFTAKIENSQIKFFQGRKETSLETDILYYNSTHYIYIYTNKEENLTLQIENILYKEADQLKSITITQNLTIQTIPTFNEETNQSETQILKIKPGFIFTASTPTIRLTNMGTSILNFTFDDKEISIPSLSSQELTFKPETTFSLTKISTYKDFLIPTVYLTATENTTFVAPSIKPNLRASPEAITLETFTENKTIERIELFNFGDTNITNLQATLSLDFISIQDLQDMPGRGIQNITLEITPQISGHFQGTVNITYTQNETQMLLEIPLSIFALPKGATPEDFEVKEESCEEISGIVCKSGTSCNSTEKYTTKDGRIESCCFGSCINMKEPGSQDSSSFGWLIGLVIFAILGYIGYYFYKQQNKIQAPKPKETIQASLESFEKRLSGQSDRTTGNLTKS